MPREGRTVPRFLELDPDKWPAPPVESKLQQLPFEQITWQNFERLCLRLVRLEAEIEFCRFYGSQGDEQEGIDLYAKKGSDPKYCVYQCKNEGQFGPAKIAGAVQDFLKGEWVEKTNTFILCTRESLRGQQRTDEVEVQRKVLEQNQIAFETWDAEELNLRLKSHPRLVDDFFGRAWAQAFCGDEEVARDLGARLDGPAAAQLRADLRTLYESIFKLADPGLPINAAQAKHVPLEHRYIVPDVIERRVRLLTVRKSQTGGDSQLSQSGSAETVDREEEFGLRRSVDEWLRENRRAVLLGGPGIGKSTLLRFLALDLLSPNPRFEAFSREHATRLPIWVPFAYWTSVLAREEASAKSLDDVLEQWLHQLGQDSMAARVRGALKDDRLLLLVDGLDEYRSEESAAVALAQISVLVAQRSCPVIATCRPAAFGKLNAFHLEWRSTQLAELSSAQQKALGEVWFRQYFEAHTPLEAGVDVEKLTSRAAEDLVGEIRKSPGLVDLAGTPLLLGLLIYLKISNSPLPNNRFDAYRVLVNHLIAIHPATRRKAAFLTAAAPNTFSVEDLRSVLAALAFTVAKEHPDGNFSRPEALTYITTFLADEQRGFGYRRPEAGQHAAEVLSFGESSLGILVERAPELYSFLHRVFLEHLAAAYLGQLTLNEQSACVAEKATDPQWREILLCFLHQLTRQDEVDGFVNQLRSLRTDALTKCVLDPVLCEVAVGQFSTSVSLCNSVCSEIIEEIETGFWLPQRVQLLRLILSGIYSRKVSRLIADRIARWYPSRSTWRPNVFPALATVKVGNEVNGALIRGLWDEERTNQRAAAKALGARAGAFPELGDRLVKLLHAPQTTGVIAAVSEALLLGWPDHDIWFGLEDNLRASPSYDLRILAIRRRVLQKRATTDDKRELLYVGSRDFALAWPYKELVAERLLEGWPNDEDVMRAAIEAMEPRIFRERSLDYEIAAELLIKGFMTVPEVVAAVANVIRTERYPFLSASHAVWKLLAEKCAGNQELIAAADAWLSDNRSQHHYPEVSFAARIGWTAVAKKRLLENLDSWVPFWSAEALLDGWGMQDEEVSSGLNRLLSSDKASEIGYLLPRIIADRTARYTRLMALLDDAKCSSPGSVLAGLAEYAPDHADEIVEVALKWLPHDRIWTDSFRHQLMQLFPSDPRLRQIALNELDRRGGNVASVALAYASDAEIADRVAGIATPLPTSLRGEIVDFAEANASASQFCLNLLSLYDIECDPQLKTKAAIAYFEALSGSGLPNESLLEHLQKEVVCGGPDFPERRQAAFCGLDIIGRLNIVRDVFRNKQDSLAFDFSVHGRSNLPFVRHVLANWSRVKTSLDDQFEKALFGSPGMANVQQWSEVAEVVEEYPEPKEALLELLENNRNIQLVEGLLRMIGRVLPKSPLLLRECLRVIRGEGIPTHRWIDIDAAAELLGRDFSGDPGVRAAILEAREQERSWAGFTDGQLWALCEGWPDSPEISSAYDLYRKEPLAWGFSPLGMQLLCAKGEAGEILDVLGSIIARPLKDFSFFSRSLTRPILKRMSRDEQFRRQLIERIGSAKNTSEEVSLARMAFVAAGLDADLRKWCYSEEGIVRSSSTPWPCGTDFTTGMVRNKCEVATEILFGSEA